MAKRRKNLAFGLAAERAGEGTKTVGGAGGINDVVFAVGGEELATFRAGQLVRLGIVVFLVRLPDMLRVAELLRSAEYAHAVSAERPVLAVPGIAAGGAFKDMHIAHIGIAAVRVLHIGNISLISAVGAHVGGGAERPVPLLLRRSAIAAGGNVLFVGMGILSVAVLDPLDLALIVAVAALVRRIAERGVRLLEYGLAAGGALHRMSFVGEGALQLLVILDLHLALMAAAGAHIGVGAHGVVAAFILNRAAIKADPLMRVAAIDIAHFTMLGAHLALVAALRAHIRLIAGGVMLGFISLLSARLAEFRVNILVDAPNAESAVLDVLNRALVAAVPARGRLIAVGDVRKLVEFQSAATASHLVHGLVDLHAGLFPMLKRDIRALIAAVHAGTGIRRIPAVCPMLSRSVHRIARRAVLLMLVFVDGLIAPAVLSAGNLALPAADHAHIGLIAASHMRGHFQHRRASRTNRSMTLVEGFGLGHAMLNVLNFTLIAADPAHIGLFAVRSVRLLLHHLVAVGAANHMRRAVGHDFLGIVIDVGNLARVIALLAVSGILARGVVQIGIHHFAAVGADVIMVIAVDDVFAGILTGVRGALERAVIPAPFARGSALVGIVVPAAEHRPAADADHGMRGFVVDPADLAAGMIRLHFPFATAVHTDARIRAPRPMHFARVLRRNLLRAQRAHRAQQAQKHRQTEHQRQPLHFASFPSSYLNKAISILLHVFYR